MLERRFVWGMNVSGATERPSLVVLGTDPVVVDRTSSRFAGANSIAPGERIARKVTVGLLLLVGIGLLPGCNREVCANEGAMVTDVTAGLVYLEGASAASKRQELEASCTAKDPSYTSEVPVGTEVAAGGRWVVSWTEAEIEYQSPHRCAGGHRGCMAIVPSAPSGTYFRCTKPAAPGDYPLSDLEGELCEPDAEAMKSDCEDGTVPSPRCAPIAGRLRVHAVGPVCTTGSCTILDAELTLEGSRDAAATSAASAVGTTHLSVSYEDHGRRCEQKPTTLK